MENTIRDVIDARLKHLGLTLRGAWLRLPEDDTGRRAVSYETIRRIREYDGYAVTDNTAEALALMLGVSIDTITSAAGQLPRLGRFELPVRAERLTIDQRRVVLSVVDALLDAAAAGSGPASPSAVPAGT